jgi:ATP-dependent DNA helicase RecQ
VRAASDDSAVVIATAIAAEETRARVERSRLEMMRAFAETTWCRRALLLGYYGQEYAPPCGRCDNCRAGLVQPTSGDVQFPVGQRVEHREWGPGIVMMTEGERIVAWFDTVGYRMLSEALIRDRGLLVAAS